MVEWNVKYNYGTWAFSLDITDFEKTYEIVFIIVKYVDNEWKIDQEYDEWKEWYTEKELLGNKRVKETLCEIGNIIKNIEKKPMFNEIKIINWENLNDNIFRLKIDVGFEETIQLVVNENSYTCYERQAKKVKMFEMNLFHYKDLKHLIFDAVQKHPGIRLDKIFIK
jgi:hypothetical protein